MPFIGSGHTGLRRVGAVARALPVMKEQMELGGAGHCEVAQMLAVRVALPGDYTAAFGAAFERWDGRGHPRALRGDQIPLSVRIAHVADDADLQLATHGDAAACDAATSATARERPIKQGAFRSAKSATASSAVASSGPVSGSRVGGFPPIAADQGEPSASRPISDSALSANARARSGSNVLPPRAAIVHVSLYRCARPRGLGGVGTPRRHSPLVRSDPRCHLRWPDHRRGRRAARTTIARRVGSASEQDQIRQWWGPGEFTCPEAEVDLRPGGSYRLAMQPTAGEAFIVGGTYREVEPPLRLVYTWRWETGPAADGSESLVTIEFHAREGRTELILTHTEFPESHGPAPYQMGWEGGLDKFEALFAGSRVDA